MTFSITALTIDPLSLPAATAQLEHERKVAVFDLLERNYFKPTGSEEAGILGPFSVDMALEDNRLVMTIKASDQQRRLHLSLSPFKVLMRDYAMICESYFEVLKSATPAQIESIDMGRRGIHNDGANLVKDRLEGKVEIDFETARRLFTLIYTLHFKA